ncbi:MAG TPA: sigma-E factor regulatory protein RseB domain-containing protein [Streptosporangiaceae bacterium]
MTTAGGRSLPRLAGAVLLMATLLTVLFVTPAPGSAAVRQAPADSDDAALKLLQRSADAARTCPYTGVQFISAWSGTGTSTSVVDVTHHPGHGTMMRVRGTGNEPSGGAYVLDDPSQAQAPAGGLSGPTDEQLWLLGRNYTVHPAPEGTVGADDTVGGRAARVVEVRRRDGSVAARFWIDKAENLLLRREIFDSSGRLVQASAFVSVELHGGDMAAAATEPRPPWGDRLRTADITRLRRAGWTIPASLPGGLSLYDARRGGGPSAPVLHLGYSDGLSVVSLFVQRGRLDDARLGGWRRVERHRSVMYVSGTVQQRLAWAARGHVYTVFADAPGDVTAKVVAALPHESRPGFWTRIGHGLTRVVSWLNPFA